MATLLIDNVINETYKKIAFVDSNTLFTSGDGSADTQPRLDNLQLNGTTALTSTSAELNQLDGVSAGTAQPNRALIMGASANIAGIGTVGCGAITSTGALIGTNFVSSSVFRPDASDGASLGTSTHEFSDLFLADGAVLSLGDGGSDVTFTHIADTGVLLNDTNKIHFGYTSQFIHGSSSTILSLGATDEIDLTATAIDINGTVDISDNAVLNGNVTLGSGASRTVTINGVIAGASPLVFEGSTPNAYETTFAITDPTADRTITFPNATGTVSMESSADTLTGKTLAGVQMTGNLDTRDQNITRTAGGSTSIWAGTGTIHIGDTNTTAVTMKNLDFKSSGSNATSDILCTDDGVIQVKRVDGTIPFKIDNASSNKQITMGIDANWKSLFKSDLEIESGADTTFLNQNAIKFSDGTQVLTIQRPVDIASSKTITLPDKAGELFVQGTAPGTPTEFKGSGQRQSSVFKFTNTAEHHSISSYQGYQKHDRTTVGGALGTETTIVMSASNTWGLFIISIPDENLGDYILFNVYRDNADAVTVTEINKVGSRLTGVAGTANKTIEIAHGAADVLHIVQLAGNAVLTNVTNTS